MTLTDWRAEAMCRGECETMYGSDNRSIADALALCASCPVRETCLTVTMASEDPERRFGVAGGLSAPDRYRLAGRGAARQRRWKPPSSRLVKVSASYQRALARRRGEVA